MIKYVNMCEICDHFLATIYGHIWMPLTFDPGWALVICFQVGRQGGMVEKDASNGVGVSESLTVTACCAVAFEVLVTQ
jgi:hypothetical protein